MNAWSFTVGKLDPSKADVLQMRTEAMFHLSLGSHHLRLPQLTHNLTSCSEYLIIRVDFYVLCLHLSLAQFLVSVLSKRNYLKISTLLSLLRSWLKKLKNGRKTSKRKNELQTSCQFSRIFKYFTEKSKNKLLKDFRPSLLKVLLRICSTVLTYYMTNLNS